MKCRACVSRCSSGSSLLFSKSLEHDRYLGSLVHVYLFLPKGRHSEANEYLLHGSCGGCSTGNVTPTMMLSYLW